jgi:hypothetical protein
LTEEAGDGLGAGVNAQGIHLMRPDGRGELRLTGNTSDDNESDWSWRP